MDRHVLIYFHELLGALLLGRGFIYVGLYRDVDDLLAGLLGLFPFLEQLVTLHYMSEFVFILIQYY